MIIYNQSVQNKIPLPLSIEIEGSFLRYDQKADYKERKEFFNFLEDYIGDDITVRTFIGDEEPVDKLYMLDGVYFKDGIAGLKLLPSMTKEIEEEMKNLEKLPEFQEFKKMMDKILKKDYN